MAFPKPPLWLQYILAFIAAAVVLAVIVVFVVEHNTADSTPASLTPGRDTSQLNQVDRELLIREQAPHTVKAVVTDPVADVEVIVANAVTRQIEDGTIHGRITAVPCVLGATPTKVKCTVIVSDVKYPYAARVNATEGTITYCRVDPSLVAGHTVPLSPRCS